MTAQALDLSGGGEELSGRKFKSYPGAERQRFLDFIKTKKPPESFPGLCLGSIDKKTPFIKITEFTVSRESRKDGDKVPCAMCHPDKFLHGFLVWLPSIERIAIIGHCCADKENLATANREYEERIERDRIDDFLLANLPLVDGLRSALRLSLPIAEEADRVHREFCRKFNPLMNDLRRSRQEYGSLVHIREVEKKESVAGVLGPRGLGRDDEKLFEPVKFGPIRGEGVLRRKFNLAAKVRILEQRLQSIPAALDEKHALQIVADRLTDDEKRNAVAWLSSFEREYLKVRNPLQDFREFFSAENFRRISRWLASDLNSKIQWVEFRQSKDVYAISGDFGGGFTMMKVDAKLLNRTAPTPPKLKA